MNFSELTKMKCVTAAVFCALLSIVYSNETHFKEPSKLSEKMQRNTVSSVSATRLERRKKYITNKNRLSYVSFNEIDSFVCCGSFVRSNGAVTTTDCAVELLRRTLTTITAVVGDSHLIGIPPLHIDRIEFLQNMDGLKLVVFCEHLSDSVYVQRAPLRIMDEKDRFQIGYITVARKTNFRGAYTREPEYAGVYHRRLYEEFKENSPMPTDQADKSFLLFRHGVLQGISKEISYEILIPGNLPEHYIFYEKVPGSLYNILYENTQK